MHAPLTFLLLMSGDFVRRMQREIEALLSASGLRLYWQEASGSSPAVRHAGTIEVAMRGTCRPAWFGQSFEPVRGQVILGWTEVRDGRVQPEPAVDCDRIGGVIQSLAPRLDNPALLQRMHYRLLSRVLAHQLMHALFRTPVHYFSYNTGRPLRPSELLEPVTLEPSQLAALRPIGAPSS
jgi:hypothetical protein